MSEVWIHWTMGNWYMTKDGIALIGFAPEVTLKDVRFVIDPEGIERMRVRGKRSTCAWAVGERIDNEPVPDGEILMIGFRPAFDDHFHVGGVNVSGCEYLYATLTPEGRSKAACMGPRYGETERRKVQQYGKWKR